MSFPRLAIIIGFSLLLVSLGCERRTESVNADAELFMVTYVVPVSFYTAEEQNSVDPADPFSSSSASDPSKSVEDILKAEGMTFPEGAAVVYSLAVSRIGLRNTRENHSLMQQILDRELPGRWRVYEPAESIADLPNKSE